MQERTLLLSDAHAAAWPLPLDRGGCYRLVVQDTEQAQEALAVLDASVQGLGVLPTDGGLLGGMSVAANLQLALAYGHATKTAQRADWDAGLVRVLRRCGLSEARLQQIGREPVLSLGRLERWLLGLVRFVLNPPTLLVLDRALEGLTPQQVNTVLRAAEIYQTDHPTRPVLWLDLAAYALPPIPACAATLELEAQTCPS